MLKTRSRLPEKVVLFVAKILESARPFVEFQGFTRQRQKCCWKFAKRRYNGRIIRPDMGNVNKKNPFCSRLGGMGVGWQQRVGAVGIVSY